MSASDPSPGKPCPICDGALTGEFCPCCGELGRFAIAQLGPDAARIFLRILTERLDVQVKDVLRDHTFLEDLGADSLDVMEVFMRLEDELGVNVADDEQTKMKTVGAAIEALARALRRNLAAEDS